MVARTGFSATTSRKSRQARKGAAVVAMSGAGGELVRAASFHELRSGLTGFGDEPRADSGAERREECPSI